MVAEWPRILNPVSASVPLVGNELLSPPAGSSWATNGLFVDLVGPEVGLGADCEWRPLLPSERLVQVDMASRSTDGGCVYLLQEGATQLLHIPPHVFSVLSAHQDDHHTDRHFATHTVSFRRSSSSHMLINAHPLFADAAFAGGCINEPLPDDSPTMELTLARLKVAPRREQPDPTALHHWAAFTSEHPEVLEVSAQSSNQRPATCERSSAPRSSLAAILRPLCSDVLTPLACQRSLS